MYRFLRSPKWLFGHVLVLVVVVTFTNLGLWQVRRLDEARTHNAQLEEHMSADAVSLGVALEEEVPFAHVTTTGEYLSDAQMLTAPRARDGSPGNHVLTPLETVHGVVLVDRGWVPFTREGVPPEMLLPPEGQVSVTGLLMPSEVGDPGQGEYLRTIVPAEVTERTGVGLVPGYVQLQSSVPSPEGQPLPHADPVLDEGNHLSYAVQWFLFTGVVVVGYPILVRRTARDRRLEDASGDSRAEPPVPAGA